MLLAPSPRIRRNQRLRCAARRGAARRCRWLHGSTKFGQLVFTLVSKYPQQVWLVLRSTRSKVWLVLCSTRSKVWLASVAQTITRLCAQLGSTHALHTAPSTERVTQPTPFASLHRSRTRLREQPDERREPERPLGTQVFAHLHLATNLAGTLSSFMKKPALAALKKVGPRS